MANDAVSNLGKWLWYLIPANPILVRVVEGGSKRIRHLWYRFGYLVVLFFVFFVFFMGSPKGNSLSEAARIATSIFQFVAQTQLALICLLSAVFTAGAITQERDAQTFNILLTTPLSNAQIIFGSLFSRLYFVLVLLISGLPIFCITMIYGGVTLNQIILSFSLAAMTALVTGSVAIMISMIRVGTRRTMFSFISMIGLYLLAVWALGYWEVTWVPEASPVVGGVRKMSWLVPFHPFLALEVGLGQVSAPPFSEVAHYGWPSKYLLAYPQASYMTMSLAASVLMMLLSMLFVRGAVKEGEPTLWNTLMSVLRRTPLDSSGERRRKPRRVWSNPIAWREANTKAAASSSHFTRWVMMIGGVLLALCILMYLIKGWSITYQGSSVTFGVQQARHFLHWLISIELVMILLVVTNAAATSMTRERESNTMDILMTTPLTSRDIVWGKLRGLISFSFPLMAVPICTMLIFVVYDLIMLGRNPQTIVNFESAIWLGAVLLADTALACVIGLHTSLKSKQTVRAVLISITIVFAVFGLMYAVGNALVNNTGGFGAFMAPFTPFTATAIFTFPDQYGLTGSNPTTRLLILMGTCFSTAIYLLVVGGMYKSLIRNFDMTIRKQSAST